MTEYKLDLMNDVVAETPFLIFGSPLIEQA